MVTIDVKGIHTVKAKGKTYYYAWRGGPRLSGEPGTNEFMKSFNEAMQDRIIPDASKFRAVVTLYKASPDYQGLADSTKRSWNGWIDRISEKFGDLSIAQFNRTDAIRVRIRQWRNEYAATPRGADYGMQVLSRILSYAIDPLGKVTTNPCEGIKHLYNNNRADLIWEEQDLKQILEISSKEVGWAIMLAAHTGLRASDLFRLSWNHVGSKAIVISTGKSGQRREAIIPLYAELRALLSSIPKLSTTILTHSKKRPWAKSGFNSTFIKNKAKLKLGKDLHFHDLRGTAATKFYIAGLSERVIAEILGWSEEEVAKIIRRYVSRNAATEALIKQIDEARPGTGIVKPPVKPSSS